jgi:site-specific DNA-methyltransferase (adenine-specific)
MQTLPLSAINIRPDRQRKAFRPEALGELTDSISSKGLLHAPVMRQDAGVWTLVAGERRLRALQEMWLLGSPVSYNNQVIPEGQVPYVTLGELTPLEAEEAELDENLRREALTWQESAEAMARLHRLRTAQANQAGRVHTVADTAMEVKGRSDGSYQESVRKEILVARHLDNPEVAKAKNTEEAFKILKRQEESAKNVALAKSVGATFTKSLHKVLNVSCLTWMKATDETFDVILTDPPYGMGADQFGDGGGGRLANNEHHYDDSPEAWRALMQEWCPLSFKVAKTQAHAYVFCDFDKFHELKALMQQAGWYVFRTPFIAHKPNSGRVPLPTEGPRRQYEIILYAIKGHKPVTAIYPDVISTVAEGGFLHGAQKPVALFSDLLKRSVRPGDTVLDCFGGSGTTLEAAHQMKCAATVLEQEADYYGMCLKRMEDLDKPSTGNSQELGDELAQMMGGGK